MNGGNNGIGKNGTGNNSTGKNGNGKNGTGITTYAEKMAPLENCKIKKRKKQQLFFYEFEYFNLICILKRLMLMANVKKVRHPQGECFSQHIAKNLLTTFGRRRRRCKDSVISPGDHGKLV